jgi:myo-inositol-1(or 4)-monophosphatase
MKFDYYGVLRKAAFSGGKVLLKYFMKEVDVRYKNKGNFNPVSTADLKAEREIIRVLKKAFPGYGVLCEESCSSLKYTEDPYWIIDPLDGTVNFLFGIPIFCVSIGLARERDMLAGIIYNPVSGELFYGEKGRGAYLNGRKLRVSERKKLSECMLVTGFPYDARKNRKKIMARLSRFLLKTQGIRRFGSAALDLANVARGQTDIFWESELHPWDVAAGSLLVKEAGGKITDELGGEDFVFGNKGVVATNGMVHGDVLKVLKGK